MMNHKYSTVILLLSCIIIIAIFVTGVDTYDIDELCENDNSIIKRISGTWICSITHFGEMTITSETIIELPLFNTYYTITNMTINHGYGITTNNNSYIIINKKGYYKTSVTTSFSGGGNTEYEMEMFVNGGANPHCELHRKMGTNGNVGSASFICVDYLEVNDVIDIRVTDNTNPSQDITIHTLNFNIMEIQ